MPTARDQVEEEPWVPLSVGAVLGGGGLPRGVEEGIRDLARIVSQSREGLPFYDERSSASVNVVFHVPGNLLSPDFEGIRTGSWIGKRRIQVIQVAVPRDVGEPNELSEFLASSIEEAIPLATERLARFRRSSGLSTSAAAIAAERAATELRRGLSA